MSKAKKNTKTAAKKSTPKTAAKAAPKKVLVSSGNGAPRSAARGGAVPQERYAKDPKSVAARLKEKANKALTQAANAIARAESAGVENGFVTKLQNSMDGFEAAKKALA